MSLYEQRLQADLNEIKRRLADVGGAVRGAVDGAMQALAAHNIDQLHAVVLGDLPINREVRAIDALCHAFIARHLPAAHHLRFVSAAMRLGIALERTGDYAVSIGRLGARMPAPIGSAQIQSLLSITLDSCLMLEQATQAFVDEDAALARETKAMADRVDRKMQAFFEGMFTHPPTDDLRQGYSILSIASRLERVSDQAKNICEEAIFIATGETKPPKVYRVLFVDRDNSFLGPLAREIGAKGFVTCGSFRTQGLHAAAALRPDLTRAGTLLGLDIESAVPAALTPMESAPVEHHVIVLLEGLTHDDIPAVPFSTAVVRWDVHAPNTEAMVDEQILALGRDLGSRIQALMEVLRGADAI